MEGLSQRCPLPPAAQGCPRPGRGTVLLVLTLLVLVSPLLRGLAVQLHSAVTGSYVPGTHSIAFVTCLNEHIARDIARVISNPKFSVSNVKAAAANPGQHKGVSPRLGVSSELAPTAPPVSPRAIMDKRLAAGVNILPKSSALYFWKGELEESTEILLLVKTRTSKIGELSNYVRISCSSRAGGALSLWPGPRQPAVKPQLEAEFPRGRKELRAL